MKKNVAVYIKRSQDNENENLEYIQSIFNCCLHKNANICKFYIEQDDFEQNFTCYSRYKRKEKKQYFADGYFICIACIYNNYGQYYG